ncbi:MAG: FAD-binding protein [Halieaceae bacterium]
MTDLSAQLQEQVREARAAGRSLAICTNRSKPWVALASKTDVLSLAGHRGVISYDPTELVITVRAGTSLAEIDAMLAEQGQMLAMEAPDFNGKSSIGGAVALGWAGSRSTFAGGVRDAVLGLRMINGLGEDLQFGGRVMKNVAGFDVSRLMVGSSGRLGGILELSLKVIPRPEQEITLQWSYPHLAETQVATASWTALGYPLSGASFYDGLLKARFSGSAAMLAEVTARLGGESVDNDYWRQLQRLELPLFHHGWGDDKLFDCNGEVCWTAHNRCRGAGPVVGLAEGPQAEAGASAVAGLQARVAAAFDPAAVFQSPRAA